VVNAILTILDTPVFFIRDPAKFPRFIHTQKTDPATNYRDWNTFWSWPAQFPESLLQFLRLFSDLGTPYGFRHMDAWSGHTYKLVQDDGSFVYTRVQLSTDQGIR
jgi:catalase